MILLAVALLAAAPSAPSAPRGRLALVISGGVSLGNYEAGLTWAVVRYLRLAGRRTDFAAVTGASAGATNALMAAAMWCEDPSETRDDDPNKNLFHDLWAPVGLDELLPEDESAFNSADGLLTAAPLERAYRRVRAQLFGHGGLRFRPGCAVSVGITVTRDRPEDRQVAGLRAGTQRFVIPWRFEVDASGQARVVPAPLGSDRESAGAQILLGEPPGGAGIGPLQASEAMLASGAFPFAFRPRELCDCALQCPEEDVVRDGSCEGPDFGQRITALSCSSFAPTAPRQLCRRRYIDGGIFDNAPIGLAVDLAETAGANPLPFAPTVYVVVDPDHRRLEPESARPGMSGLAAPAELLSTLIATARASELGRAIRDERWQRTTQSTLADAAQVQAEAAAVQEEMARIAGASGGETSPTHGELFRSPRREALGSFLLRCLGDLRRAFDRPGDLAREEFASCAEALRDGTAGTREPHASRPSPADVVALARALAAVFASSSRRADETLAELGAAETPFDRQLLLLARVHDLSTIGIASFRFLIGEVPGVAESGLSEVELLQLQRDLLGLAGVGGRLLRATSSMLRVLLSASLLEEQVEGTLPVAAADARRELDAGGDPNFDSPPLRAMAAASDRIARLVALAPRLRNLSVRAASIASNAAQLSSAEGAERQLVLSRRFSPLGGGTLLNFSAFLDRPLRELDFYVGVYDAVVQFASRDCEIQGPYPMGERPAPIFRADAALELDRSAADTQRCLGQAVRSAVEALRLLRSARAAFVIARLARLEVTANLGSRSSAARMLAEPSWSWLGDPQLPPEDQLGRALTAVTACGGISSWRKLSGGVWHCSSCWWRAGLHSHSSTGGKRA